MKKKIDLTTGSIVKKLLIVAIPTLFTSIIQMAYNLTDMFWVGKVGSMGLNPDEAIAAVGTAGYYMWFGFGLILLAKIGTSVMISQSAGKNDMNLVTKYGNSGFVLMLLFAIVYSLLGYLGSDLYMDLFNLDSANVLEYSTSYLKVVSMFVISMFMVNFFNGVNDGLGKTINTLLITSSGLFLNIVLDPFFILEKVNVFGSVLPGLGMGVKGAAIATVIAQTFILCIYVVFYFSKHRPFTINPKKYFEFKYFKQILKIGLPIGIQSMLFTSISIVLGIMIVSYGASVMAIQRVGSQIEALAWMIASGFQVALASFVGQNFGALKHDRIRKGYFTALKLLVPYGIVVNIVLFVFAEQLFSIFFHTESTLAIGKTYLEILSFSQLFMIVELTTAGAFNGLGKTKIPSSVGIIGNGLRIPFAMLFSVSLGFAGIWWVVSISSIAKGVILTAWFIFYLRRVKKMKSVLS